MKTIQGSGPPQARAAAIVSTPAARAPSRAQTITHSRYLTALGALFAFFSSARVLAYLPTIWAVVASGDSSQHSLVTWLTFFGGNSTMAVWLWEHNGRRCNAAIAASGGNSLMCLAIIAVVIWTRL